jgi:hypothetical protein
MRVCSLSNEAKFVTADGTPALCSACVKVLDGDRGDGKDVSRGEISYIIVFPSDCADTPKVKCSNIVGNFRS